MTIWSRYLVAGLSLQRPGFNPRPARVGFVVHGVALGYVFLGVGRFYPASIIQPMLHTDPVIVTEARGV
jgi:hypothetical protein